MEHHEGKELLESGKKGKEIVGGIHIGKQDLWMLAGGALGALALLGLGKASEGTAGGCRRGKRGICLQGVGDRQGGETQGGC